MKYRYQSGDTVYDVLLERYGDGYQVTVNGESYNLEVLDSQPGVFALRFEKIGEGADAAGPAEAGLVRPQVVYWGAEADVKWLSSDGCTYRLERPQERARGRAGSHKAAVEDLLRAPMPAQVRAVQVAEGERVEVGQPLMLLEAMKMEIKLASPRAARVARLLAKQGETVERDQVLVELEG